MASSRRVALTDRLLRSLKPAAPGERDRIRDVVVPGLVARITDKGYLSFLLGARFPGDLHYTQRELGSYPAMTLEAARAKARRWLERINAGIDPRLEEERRKLEQLRKQKNTFASVVEDFAAEKLSGERKGAEVKRDIERDLLPAWSARPITEISELDLLPIIKAKKQQAPSQARNLLGTAKRLFAWAKDQRVYGLAANPFAELRPGRLIGDKASGDRTLSDDELFALHRAAGRMPYPYGPVYLTLLLAGLRLNEVADASWPEIDLRRRTWVIPPSRMKGKNGKARAHAVPLTDELMDLLNALPRFTGGDYLFSTTFGAKPVWIGSKIKQQVDKRMLRTLRALARRRGDDPAKVALAPWVNHDARRSVRSQLSRLKVAEEVREAVLAHVRPGIKGTYDHHDYFDEKREALTLWAARLRQLVEPLPANVVQMPARA